MIGKNPIMMKSKKKNCPKKITIKRIKIKLKRLKKL
jgi:hypothetical protein